MKKLFVIEYDNTEGVTDMTFVAADDLPTHEEAEEILKAGEFTDYTDTPVAIWELGQVWTKGGGEMYEIELREVKL